MIYIFLITSLVIFFVIKYYFHNKSHKFWNNQPVSHNQTNEGIISNNLPSPLELKDYHKISKCSPNDKSYQIFLVNFLNQHYVKDYKYNIDYVSWYNQFPHLKDNNILCLKYKNDIIGNIIAKPYALKINNKTIFTHYVDMLAVHKRYRNKNNAPILISSTVEKSTDNQFKTFIFKKEEEKLPFNYICKAKYYVFNINNNIIDNNPTGIYSLHNINNNDLDYIEKLYKKESVKYKCYPLFDKDQNKYLFSTVNNVYEALIIKENGVNKGVITYVVNYLEKNTTKVAEIVLFLCEDIDYVDSIKTLVNYCNKKNIDSLICINIAKNRIFIDRMNFNAGMDVYFHMYNYHLLNRLNTNDILFNFV